MLAHVAGAPVEELLPLALSAGTALVASWRVGWRPRPLRRRTGQSSRS